MTRRLLLSTSGFVSLSACSFLRRSETPELVPLAPGNWDVLRQDFNAARNETRLLVLLSPT